jgi:hypothetical protein
LLNHWRRNDEIGDLTVSASTASATQIQCCDFGCMD